MKIYFVDDEPLTLEFLEEIIDWQSLNLEVMGTASNGKKALSRIEKEMPDILVSDIRMPVMDGVSLIKEVRNISSETRIIVLSAYSDFEYARKVFSSGISGYLVKPIDEDKLLELIKKTIEELETLQLEKEKSSLIQNLAIETLLSEQISKPEPEDVFFGKFNKLSKAPDLSDFQMLSISVPGKSPARSLISQLLEDRTINICLKNSYLVKGETGNWLLISKEHTGSGTVSAIESVFQSVLDSQAFVTVSARHHSPTELRVAYNEVCYLNSLRFYNRDYCYTFYRKRSPLPPDTKVTLNESAETCYSLIRKQNFPTVKKYIEDLDDNIIRMYEADITGYKNFWTLFCLFIRNRLLKDEYSGNLPHELNNLNSTSFQTYKQASDITACIQNIIQQIMEEPLLTGEDDRLSQIRDVKIYIKNNFAEKITLEDIADQFSMSRNYLSRLFKDTTGTTLWDYLTQSRIKYASTLLKETGKGTAEIAVMAGYDNQGYFSSVFKKNTGMSPMQYRKKNQ